MLTWLHRKLRLDILSDQMTEIHRNHQTNDLHWQVVTERWKYIAGRLADINDHLVEIKERVNTLSSEPSETFSPVMTSSPAEMQTPEATEQKPRQKRFKTWGGYPS
jgi:hypothetical protein